MDELNPLGPLGWDAGSVLPLPLVPPVGPPPLFGGSPEPWTDVLADESTLRNLALLRAGQATTIVTGQQPGRLVGPLYTLFKIATAVDLAAHLTREGCPAVPVFWSGDADDDLDEAMAPMCWDPGSDGFLNLPRGPGRKQPGRRHPMVGRLPASETVRDEADWLDRVATGTGHSLARDLADIWAQSIAEGDHWGRLQRRALDRVFAGTGLVIVSGDDPALHRMAAPLYKTIFDGLPELVTAGREGEGPTAIADHSWNRPLYRVEGDERVPVGPGERPGSSGDFRPGVVFRSPVQDWLLQPAAVVAGPGELAYLNQLKPLYGMLGIPRSPIIPRLSGWLLPSGGVETSLLVPDNPDEAALQAVRVASVGSEELVRILTGELGLDDTRARDLARGRTRRWIKGLETMLHDQARRARAEQTARYPGWVFPGGHRQERTLAAGCALALWGQPLMDGIVEAAARHREAGSGGNWHTFGLTVPEPAQSKGTP